MIPMDLPTIGAVFGLGIILGIEIVDLVAWIWRKLGGGR